MFSPAARAQTPLLLGDLDADNRPTVIDLQRLVQFLAGRASIPASRDVLVPASGTNAAVPSTYLDLDDNGVIDQADIQLLQNAILGLNALPSLPMLHITEASPANGEELVSPARTVILRFDREIEPATLNATNFYLIANGARLPGRIEVSSTRRFATFFPSNNFPASTEIRLVVDGTNVRSRDGWAFSAGGADGSSARSVGAADGPSALHADFRTLPLFRIPGTHVWGYVFDSYNTNANGSLSQRSPNDTNHVAESPLLGERARVRAYPSSH